MTNELKPCPCGGTGCTSVTDSLLHQCGGPREACGVPGCPECRAQSSDPAHLPRYCVQWNGPIEPIVVPGADGYWTPWHIAHGLMTALERERDEARRRVAELEAELQSARDALGLAWFAGGVSLDDAIRRKTAALETLSGTTSTIDALIADAVQREREACAEVCEARGREHRATAESVLTMAEEEEADTWADESEACAAAIRARGEGTHSASCRTVTGKVNDGYCVACRREATERELPR